MTKTPPICTIIGFTGRSGAGKDTCAALIQEINSDFVSFGIADTLKSEVAEAFSTDQYDLLYNCQYKEQISTSYAINKSADLDFIERMRHLGLDLHIARTPRQIMQLWGNEYRRHQDENYWLQRALLFIHELIKIGTKGIIISDVRFTNEAATIKACGGHIVLITRESADKAPVAHASEDISSLSAYVDHIIQNPENNLGQLAIRLNDLLESIKAHETQTASHTT